MKKKLIKHEGNSGVKKINLEGRLNLLKVTTQSDHFSSQETSPHIKDALAWRPLYSLQSQKEDTGGQFKHWLVQNIYT